MIIGPAACDQAGLEGARDADPVVQRYRAFFALLDWEQVAERDPGRPWPGTLPQPRAAYIKALLVKLCERKPYITQLRGFLVEHPLLVLELGFRPVGDPTQPYGFDVARTVPSARWLRHQQQTLPERVLQALLRGTVHALQAELPALGTTVAVDVKHIYAWVQENNPKAYVRERHDPARHRGAIPIVAWASSAARTRRGGRGRRRCTRNTSGATARGWSVRPTRAMAMWCWPR
jgi:hypothetical protein